MTDQTDQTTAKDIAPVEQRQPAPADNTAAILSVIERAARDPNVDVDKMERLFAMQGQILTRKAEMEFNAAMADAQGEMEPIVRDAENKQTSSKYARLEQIAKAVKPITSKHGFAMSFGTDDCPIQDHYRITCDLSHTGGHSKRYHADVPADLTGMKGTANKTKTHAFGSTMSYGRRYLTLLIFDLATADDDGNAAGAGEPITEEQAHELRRLMKMTNTEPAKFLEFMKADRLEDLPISQYGKADAMLNAKLMQQQREQADATTDL